MAQLDKRFIGSISEGTLRTQDLLPRFISVLEQADPENRAVKDYAEAWNAAATLAEWTNVGNQNAEDVLEAIGYWDSEQTGYLLNEDVFDALNEVAPEGTSFGASEGDGASFGFWYIDCDACGKSLGDHSPEGQGCDDEDYGEDTEITLEPDRSPEASRDRIERAANGEAVDWLTERERDSALALRQARREAQS